jgi:hypothetical protein
MSIRIAPLPEGTRVKIVQADLPLDPRVMGRIGAVVAATEYRSNAVGVLLDGDTQQRWFRPAELAITQNVPLLPPERVAAKQIKSLP